LDLLDLLDCLSAQQGCGGSQALQANMMEPATGSLWYIVLGAIVGVKMSSHASIRLVCSCPLAFVKLASRTCTYYLSK
jgi:hypothetical protein